MSKTKIEWATEVWNPVTGCTKVSPSCANCYAARMANRLKGRYGYPADDPFAGKGATMKPGLFDSYGQLGWYALSTMIAGGYAWLVWAVTR